MRPLAHRIAAVAARRLAGDARALALLDAAPRERRVLVRSVPAAPRTLVARELCRRRAHQGARVRYLCLSDAAAAEVDRRFATARRHGADVRAWPVRRLVAHLAADPRLATAAEFARLRAANLLSAPARRLDLLVVDGAEDFDAADWALVRRLAQDAELWAFWDPAQAFWSDRPLPPDLFRGAAHLDLPASRALPSGLRNALAAYADDAAAIPVTTGDGLWLRIVDAKDPRPTLARIVAGLVDAGIGGHHVAVLSVAGRYRATPFAAPRAGVEVRAADAPDAHRHLVTDTVLRHKGSMRSVVVLHDLARGTPRYATRMRIALASATALAIVVATDADMAFDPRLLAGEGGTFEATSSSSPRHVA
ncbi:MAG: hypothetical protein D6705_15890 [Deltaproteobacteria bacterium]|nr:MAG: hypothetical protein D6705_15890 [Deltaproteobacteria bacterium]